jgi:hypothetical protein
MTGSKWGFYGVKDPVILGIARTKTGVVLGFLKSQDKGLLC